MPFIFQIMPVGKMCFTLGFVFQNECYIELIQFVFSFLNFMGTVLVHIFTNSISIKCAVLWLFCNVFLSISLKVLKTKEELDMFDQPTYLMPAWRKMEYQTSIQHSLARRHLEQLAHIVLETSLNLVEFSIKAQELFLVLSARDFVNMVQWSSKVVWLLDPFSWATSFGQDICSLVLFFKRNIFFLLSLLTFLIILMTIVNGILIYNV